MHASGLRPRSALSGRLADDPSLAESASGGTSVLQPPAAPFDAARSCGSRTVATPTAVRVTISLRWAQRDRSVTYFAVSGVRPFSGAADLSLNVGRHLGAARGLRRQQGFPASVAFEIDLLKGQRVFP